MPIHIFINGLTSFHIALSMLWNFISFLDTIFIGYFILSGFVFYFIFIFSIIFFFFFLILFIFELLLFYFQNITLSFSFTCLPLFSLSCRMSWKASEYWTRTCDLAYES